MPEFACAAFQKAAMSRIQTEWFGVTSGPETDPAHVQEILEELDKISNHLLHRVINMADNNVSQLYRLCLT